MSPAKKTERALFLWLHGHERAAVLGFEEGESIERKEFVDETGTSVHPQWQIRNAKGEMVASFNVEHVAAWWVAERPVVDHQPDGGDAS